MMTKETPLLNGHYYHIYNRGNNGENLFPEERNYHYFLKLYIRYIYPIADTYAYCLMKNHFHLLVRINPKPDLPGFKNLEGLTQRNYSQSFSNLFNAYTKAINKAYDRSGSLFEKNFNRILIDTDRYFVHLISYIHRNPQKNTGLPTTFALTAILPIKRFDNRNKAALNINKFYNGSVACSPLRIISSNSMKDKFSI
jgi:REP element-mobilizing transposase RayT